jgi:hypothetical protein
MLTEGRPPAMHRPPRHSSQLARFAQSRLRLPSVRPNANSWRGLDNDQFR